MNDVPALLDSDQVAERLRVSRRQVERLAATGALVSVRLGARAVRFDPKDVEAFIAARKSEPVEAAAS